MQFVNGALPISPITPEIAVKRYAYVTQNGITARQMGAGNAATPIADKTIVVAANSILFVCLLYNTAVGDTQTPLFRLLDGGAVLRLQLGFPIGSGLDGGEYIGIQGLAAATYTINIDMAGIVNGGCAYAAYVSVGGES